MKKIWLFITLSISSLVLVDCQNLYNPEMILDEAKTHSFWIVHNIKEWTITLDNWEESITIMDKNIWANVAWTWEESFWYPRRRAKQFDCLFAKYRKIL